MFWMFYLARGRGRLALAGPGLLGLVLAADDAVGFLPKGATADKWILVAFLLTSGLITAGIGIYLNRGPGSLAVDPTTGREYFDTSARHSFYRVPLQYWGYLYCLI